VDEKRSKKEVSLKFGPSFAQENNTNSLGAEPKSKRKKQSGLTWAKETLQFDHWAELRASLGHP